MLVFSIFVLGIAGGWDFVDWDGVGLIKLCGTIRIDMIFGQKSRQS